MRKAQAYRIVRDTEDEYDEFLDTLFKRKKKKQAAAIAAEKDYSDAVKERKPQIGQRLKQVFEDIGGVEGASGTLQNILGFFKEGEAEDYEINVGSGEDKGENKKILGFPPLAFYGGAALLTVMVIAGVAMIAKRNKQKLVTQAA